MGRIAYDNKSFRADATYLIETSDKICREYRRQGYDLTLRQLYYVIVSRDLFPADRKWTLKNNKWVKDPQGTINAEPNYDWLGRVISEARENGELDWNYIVDRTRNLVGWRQFDDPADCIMDAAEGYGIDLWDSQPNRIELWVEKEALAGIVERIAGRWNIPYFCCRGYVSQSEMHSAAKRLQSYVDRGQNPVIIHLGDHDPSGIDMTRDIRDRLSLYMTNGLHNTFGVPEGDVTALRYVADNDVPLTVERVALTIDQVRQYNPPPNPAKLTDSRAGGYIEEYGNESWELDALTPQQMTEIVDSTVNLYLIEENFDEAKKRQKEEREQMMSIAKRMKSGEVL